MTFLNKSLSLNILHNTAYGPYTHVMRGRVREGGGWVCLGVDGCVCVCGG